MIPNQQRRLNLEAKFAEAPDEDRINRIADVLCRKDFELRAAMAMAVLDE